MTLLEQLQTVVIQDAAALAVRFPTRMKHKLFELPVFQSVAFSEYTATMRATLDQSIAPWDASLEQIMPGLNTRFNSLQSGITANSAVLREITNTRIPQLQKECNNIRPGVSIEFDKFRRILNECFQANAAITSDVRHSEDGLTSDNNTPVMYNASPHSPNSVVPQGGRKNPYPGYGYKLPSVNRASELWFAWFGEGLFKDKPIPGGIDQLIKDNNKDWRSCYDSSENRMFSRWKIIIGLMKEERGGRNDLDYFLTEMDQLYDQSKSKTVTPFHALLQKRDKRRRLNTTEVS